MWDDIEIYNHLKIPIAVVIVVVIIVVKLWKYNHFVFTIDFYHNFSDVYTSAGHCWIVLTLISQGESTVA